MSTGHTAPQAQDKASGPGPNSSRMRRGPKQQIAGHPFAAARPPRDRLEPGQDTPLGAWDAASKKQ